MMLYSKLPFVFLITASILFFSSAFAQQTATWDSHIPDNAKFVEITDFQFEDYQFKHEDGPHSTSKRCFSDHSKVHENSETCSFYNMNMEKHKDIKVRMNYGLNSLYTIKITTKSTQEKLITETGCAKGLLIAPDGKHFFFRDAKNKKPCSYPTVVNIKTGKKTTIMAKEAISPESIEDLSWVDANNFLFGARTEKKYIQSMGEILAAGMDLFVWDTAKSEAVRLTYNANLNKSELEYVRDKLNISPDKRALLFSAHRGLLFAKTDGSEWRYLEKEFCPLYSYKFPIWAHAGEETGIRGSSSCRHPKWTKDGKAVMFQKFDFVYSEEPKLKMSKEQVKKYYEGQAERSDRKPFEYFKKRARSSVMGEKAVGHYKLSILANP